MATMPSIKNAMVTFENLTLFEKNKHGRFYILSWGMFKGMPRAVATINGEDREIKGRMNQIPATFNPVNFNVFVGALIEIIDAGPLSEFVIDCKNNLYVDDKRTDDIVLQTTVTVAKDKNGVIRILFVDGQKPDEKEAVEFTMLPDVTYTDPRMSDAEKSRMFMRGYVDRVKHMFNTGLSYGVDIRMLDDQKREDTLPGYPDKLDDIFSTL